MSYYQFRKRDLMKALENLSDDDFVMVNVGGLVYPIVSLEDTTNVGFFELLCDDTIDFFEALDNNTTQKQ